jgi:hypothetical protein
MKQIALLLALLQLSGCMHISRVYPDTSQEKIEQINTPLDSLRGCISTLDRSHFHGMAFLVDADSTSWMPYSKEYRNYSEERVIMPNMALDSLFVRDRIAGMKEGIKYGGITCAMIGAAAMILFSGMSSEVRADDPSENDSLDFCGTSSSFENRNPTVMILSGALVGGVAGALVGGLLGYMNGEQYYVCYRYQLPRR